MPSISDIPSASALQAQLANLNNAIAALALDGTVIPNIVVMPGVDPNAPPGTFVIAIGLTLDPPIQDPATLAQIQTALQDQAAAVTNQLVNMGFTDDSGQMVRQGPVPQQTVGPAQPAQTLPSPMPARGEKTEAQGSAVEHETAA
jgi:hypothetical protein